MLSLHVRALLVGCAIASAVACRDEAPKSAATGYSDNPANLWVRQSFAQAIPGMYCTRLNTDSADTDLGHLCTNVDAGLKFSANGRIENMRCTLLLVPTLAATHNHFLCVPLSSRVQFKWSFVGDIPGKDTCVELRSALLQNVESENRLCY